MLFVTFDIQCAERSCGAKVFAGTTTNASLGVDARNGSAVASFGGYHLYCTHRAVTLAVVALDTSGVCYAVLFYPHGMSNLY